MRSIARRACASGAWSSTTPRGRSELLLKLAANDADPQQVEWIRGLGRVSNERLICGPGLLNMHRALAEIDGRETHIDDPAERAWAAEWLAAILASEGVAVDPQAKEHLWSALGSLASAPVTERTLKPLSTLASIRSSKSLGSRTARSRS